MRFLASLLLTAALHAEKKPVTIESLMTPPPDRGGSIIWAPNGKRFTYEEKRKLMLYDVPSGKRRELVSMDKLEQAAVKVEPPRVFDWTNRRVGEQPLQWFASGKQMLVSTGGDLFVLNVENGAFDQLTTTPDVERDPKLSPDNRFISFRRGPDLYSLEIATKKVTRLTSDGTATLLNGQMDWVYPEELDLGTAHWWSPDSAHIAYLQFDIAHEPVFPQVSLLGARGILEPERYPKPGDPNADVRVGVVAVKGGPTRWMNFGETRDFLIARLAWLPDSKALAVERLNRTQNRLDLLAANASTGESRVLLHEEDPYWINIADAPHFFADGKHFLWSSERDGFRHLYLYSIEGKLQHQITRGEWEVENVAGIDEQAQQIYYVSSEDSPLERQMYVVRLDGKHKRKLTSGPGTHSISMSPTADYYLDTFSSLTQPPVSTLYDSSGTQVAVFREADKSIIDNFELRPTEIVNTKAADGALLYARIIKPPNFDPAKKYPVIVMVYGGPGVQTIRNSWPGANLDQVLAQRGFLIWQLDNRGSRGRGHAWESTIYHNMGAHELADQKDGIKYLQTLGYADTTRMGIFGWSYGGYMTLFTLCNAPGLFRAGVAGAPVTNWRNYDTIYTERYMGLPDENSKGYEDSSPVNQARNLDSKLLILHNVEDDNVHFQNTMQMADALEKADKQFRMVIYPQKSHGVGGAARQHLNETIAGFFEETLKQ